MTSILVVDDHAVNREFLVTLLSYRGYRLLEAADGVEALERARHEKPDLIIADILMPTMDGYELVRQIRGDRDISKTPVIFYTATYHEQEANTLAKSCGVAHVITKPCDPGTVLRIVDDALQTKAIPPTMPESDGFRSHHLRLVTDKLSQLAEDLGAANKRLGALIDVNLHLASESNPELLLDNFCRSARGLIGARYAVLAAGGRNGSRAIRTITAGIESATAGTFEITALDSGSVGRAYSERTAFRQKNPGGDPRALGLPAGHPPAASVLVAPIASLKHVYGWICLSERIGTAEFSDEDEKLLTILGAQVGRIYENGSLYVAIRSSEERFRQLAENINEAFFLIDPDATRILYVSPAYENIWGRSAVELEGNPRAWMESVHADDLTIVAANLEQMSKSGQFDYEFRIVRPDGEVRWIHSRGFPIRNESGIVYRVAGVAEDVTERWQAQYRIRRLNRVYAVLSGINAAIVRIRDRNELFEEACRILVEVGKFPTAWIGLLDPGSGRVIPAAWRGSKGDRDLVFRVDFSAREADPGGATTVGRAIRERQAVFTNDLGLEGRTRPIIEQMAGRGYRSIIALPLFTGDECIGVLALHSKDPHTFDEQEIALLTELAGDIGFALDYFRKEEEVKYLAFHDPLTGLANRAMLHRHLSQVTREADAQHPPFALLLMNVNNFRDINDTLGHKNGDALLNTISSRISSSLWESDVVACLGGDEFAILLPHLGAKNDIALVIRKIRNVLQKPFSVTNIPVNIEARIGVALYPDHGTTADLLWQHADIALRAAKDSHQQHVLYAPEIDHYDPGQLALLGGLREAIDRNELVLHFQPTIELKDRRAVGAEALVRWQHPVRGMLFPDQFIPLVERTGLIDPLTSWVLVSALRQGRQWHEKGLPLHLAINLSARNLQNPGLGAEILNLAREARFPLEFLTLEVTESAIMTDPGRAERVLAELHEAGIRISMDDFGIGQSSLAYLRDLPISIMKIDKSFVMAYGESRNAAIVRSAIELAHNLGISVTAEGVEDRDTCEALRELGCERAQGYYFSKPQPIDRLTAWLRESDWRWRASSDAAGR